MCKEVKIVDLAYIQTCVEQYMSERLRLAQNGIDQDDNWIIFNVLVHWPLARLLQTQDKQETSAPAIITLIKN